MAPSFQASVALGPPEGTSSDVAVQGPHLRTTRRSKSATCLMPHPRSPMGQPPETTRRKKGAAPTSDNAQRGKRGCGVPRCAGTGSCVRQSRRHRQAHSTPPLSLGEGQPNTVGEMDLGISQPQKTGFQPLSGGVFAQRAHSASYGVYAGNSPENLPPLEACMSNSKLRNSNVSCSQNYPMSKTMQCRQ